MSKFPSSINFIINFPYFHASLTLPKNHPLIPTTRTFGKEFYDPALASAGFLPKITIFPKFSPSHYPKSWLRSSLPNIHCPLNSRLNLQHPSSWNRYPATGLGWLSQESPVPQMLSIVLYWYSVPILIREDLHFLL